MTTQKKELLCLTSSLIYLAIFIIAACFLYPKLHSQNKITLPSDLTYSGYDITVDGQCTGQFYYSFEQNNLCFYLLSPENFPAKPNISVRGHFEKNNKQLKEVQTKLSKTLNWKLSELEPFIQPSYFVEQQPFSIQLKVAIGIAILLALYSIFLLFYIFLSSRQP